MCSFIIYVMITTLLQKKNSFVLKIWLILKTTEIPIILRNIPLLLHTYTQSLMYNSKQLLCSAPWDIFYILQSYWDKLMIDSLVNKG